MGERGKEVKNLVFFCNNDIMEFSSISQMNKGENTLFWKQNNEEN